MSRYLERTSDSKYKINMVEVDIDLDPELKVMDFYFDQSLLVLQIKDLESGLETLEFFSYHNNDYIHLNVIRADAYRDTLLAVDDRLSNLQKYRVAIVGRTSSDSMYM